MIQKIKTVKDTTNVNTFSTTILSVDKRYSYLKTQSVIFLINRNLNVDSNENKRICLSHSNVLWN